MAEPRTRLGRILQQEYQSKGIIGGAVSALGKRSLEKLDIRNALFGGTGLGSVIGQKIFGKGYSATSKSGSKSGVSSVSDLSQNLNSSVLEEISINSRISAKNSVVFPSMARDMNLMRMNIAKLVKLQGGTPSTKADMFFSRSRDRELMYENQMGKFSRVKSNTPQKIKTENKSLVGSLLDVFTGDILSTVLTRVITTLSTPTMIASLAGLIGLIALSRTSPGKLFPENTENLERNRINEALKLSQTEKGREQMAKAAEEHAKNAIPGTGPTSEDIEGIRAGKKIYYRRLNRETGKTEDKVVDVQQAARESISSSNKSSGFDLSKLSDEQKKMADLIYTRFTEAGFSDAQAKAAIANAIAESSLRPTASNITAKEESYGLFQMNRKGGLGSDYTPEQLKDPEFNIQLAIAAAKKSKSFTQATTVQEATKAFVTDIERPKDQAAAISKRTSLVMELESKNIGSRINQSSLNNQMAKNDNGAGNNVVTNVNNVNNNGGGSSGQILSADVMDTELGRLLMTRMY